MENGERYSVDEGFGQVNVPWGQGRAGNLRSGWLEGVRAALLAFWRCAGGGDRAQTCSLSLDQTKGTKLGLGRPRPMLFFFLTDTCR